MSVGGLEIVSEGFSLDDIDNDALVDGLLGSTTIAVVVFSVDFVLDFWEGFVEVGNQSSDFIEFIIYQFRFLTVNSCLVSSDFAKENFVLSFSN